MSAKPPRRVHSGATVGDKIAIYRKACNTLDVSPDPAVISTLLTNSDVLELSKGKCGQIQEGQWLALVQLLLSEYYDHKLATNWKVVVESEGKDFTLPFTPIRTLHASGLHVAGRNNAIVLQTLLLVDKTIVSLDVSRNHIQVGGIRNIAEALKTNTTLRHLNLHGNHVLTEGATALAEALIASKKTCSLETLDITNTWAGFSGVKAVEEAATAVNEAREHGPYLEVLTDANFGQEELANSISHGLATLAALFGASLMLPKAWAISERHFLSCFVFVTSLLTCYLASTLYHSTFMLRRTQQVFRILDYAAIYLLIAGTYTPVVLINFHDSYYAPWVLILQWIIAFFGIVNKALNGAAEPSRKELALYAFMGWISLSLYPEFAKQPWEFQKGIYIGGLSYTIGIIFFLKDRHWPMYHAVWHLFVVAGGLCHFIAIYNYSLSPDDTTIDYFRFGRELWSMMPTEASDRATEFRKVLMNATRHYFCTLDLPPPIPSERIQ